MSLLLSRNPVFAALRALVGLGLLAYGLVGYSAVNSGTAAAISPSAYLALPECPGDPVPTDGACYSVRQGTVMSSHQQLTTYRVTLADSQGNREVELANGNRFNTFQPNTAISVKYWRSSVTAVGVPVAGDASALTSTVDSPLGHSDAVAHSVRYVVAGLVALLLGVLPLLFHLSRRSGGRGVPASGVGAYGPGGPAPGRPPALYSPPAPAGATAVQPNPAPPGAPAAGPVGAPFPGLSFVVSAAPNSEAAPAPAAPAPPAALPAFTVLAGPSLAEGGPATVVAPAALSPAAPQPKWVPFPAASVHFPEPPPPPASLAVHGGLRPSVTTRSAATPELVQPADGAALRPAALPFVAAAHPLTPSTAQPSALPERVPAQLPPVFTVLPTGDAGPSTAPLPAAALPVAANPVPPPRPNSGGPGWSVREGPGPGPRQAG